MDEVRPKKEHYVECPTCTKKAGEPVVFHTSALKEDQGFFDEKPVTLCPLGHTIPEKG